MARPFRSSRANDDPEKDEGTPPPTPERGRNRSSAQRRRTPSSGPRDRSSGARTRRLSSSGRIDDGLSSTRIEMRQETEGGKVRSVSLSRTVERRSAFGLKAKFLVSIAGGIFFFVMVSGIIGLLLADGAIETEVGKMGAILGGTYATIAESYARDFADLKAENDRRPPKDKESDRRLYQRLEKKYAARLSRALSAEDQEGDVVSIIFFEADGAATERFQLNETLRGVNLPAELGQEIRVDGKSTGVRKTTVTLEVSGKPRLVHLFTAATHDAKPPMRVAVLTSAEATEASRLRMKLGMLVAIVISVLCGGALAWWLAARVTTPLEQFMTDVAVIGQGDLDHQVEVRTSDEIGQLAKAFNIMTDNLRTAQEAKLALKMQEHDMHIAAEIQANLTPSETPRIKGYDLAHYYDSAGTVGGDYVDFLELDSRRTGVIIADVSGKGVPAAMVMAMTRAFMRMDALQGDRGGIEYSPRAVLSSANQRLSDDIRRGMFVTAQYLIVDRRKHRMTFANAGHNPIVVWRARNESVELVTAGGMALGFHGGELFERNLQEKVINLDPGDRVVLYTDGVTEAMDADRQQFGEKRLYAVTKKAGGRSSEKFVAYLVAQIEKFRGDAAQSDDVSVISLMRKAT